MYHLKLPFLAFSLTLTLEAPVDPVYLSYGDAILRGFDFYLLENATYCEHSLLGVMNHTLEDY